jgi:RNA polymerase sigma-70 factor (ECF subfamily)
MDAGEVGFGRGLRALRLAVAEQLELLAALPSPLPAGQPLTAHEPPHWDRDGVLWALADAGSRRRQARADASTGARSDSSHPSGLGSDRELATSSLADKAEADRLISLVELARGGDCDAFGLLYDHYQPSIYRFLYYRTGSVTLAEDLTSETFLRALRSMSSFRWQGKDFGAWLTTIARNLATDHVKSGRARLESATEDMTPHDSATEGPESAVLTSLTNEALLKALKKLPAEQLECLVMRFLQGLSIAETARVLGRSDGAVKQLQLRGVRNLAKLIPEGLR